MRAGGQTYIREIEHIIGHPQRPMTIDDVRRKFLTCTTPRVGEDGAAEWFDRLAQASALSDASEILNLPAIARTPE